MRFSIWPMGEIMALRNTTVKLRLLDKVKLREAGKTWAWANTLGPILMVFLTGILFQFFRRRKYTSAAS